MNVVVNDTCELGRSHVHFLLNDTSKLGRGHVHFLQCACEMVMNVAAAMLPMVNGEC
jgi:hypothetical protein